MKRIVAELLVLSILVVGFAVNQSRGNAASAPGACTYQCAYYDPNGGGFTYALRTDGVLVRLHTGDWEVYVYPNPAPPGRYVALYPETNNPYFTGFIAMRDDGAVFFRASANPNQWQLMATLPQCEPIATAPSSLGSVKSKYR